MTEKTRLQLLAWAREYHCAAFIQGDPVQFPHRYTQKQDIEISGLLTAIMSFGNRKQILKKADDSPLFCFLLFFGFNCFLCFFFFFEFVFFS